MGGFALPMLPAHMKRAPSIDHDASSAAVVEEPAAPAPVAAAAAPAPAGQFTAVPGGRAGAVPPPLPRVGAAPPPLPVASSSAPPPLPQQQPPARSSPTLPSSLPTAQPPVEALPQQAPVAAQPSPAVAAVTPAAAPAVPSGGARSTGAPAMPPPATAEERAVSRSMLSFLLEELSPAVFTRKKDALDTFESYYWRAYPAYTAPEIRALLFGCTAANPQEKAKGIFALCGATSWKSSGQLKKAAAQALGLLAKLCDQQASPHAQTFLQIFMAQEATTMLMLKLGKHLSTPRGNRHAASFLLSVLKTFKAETYEKVQRELAREAPEEAASLKNMRNDMLAKRLSMRSNEDVLKKKTAYGAGAGQLAPVQEKSASSPGDDKKKEKSSIKDRLKAFFGGRPSASDLERKGLLRTKSFAVALEDLYRTPALVEPAKLALGGEVLVPVALKACMVHMVKAGIVDMQGVFRLSGDSIEIAATREKLDVGVPVDLSRVGPHSVSGLVKLFLRLLPQPLLCFENYDSLVAAFRASDFAAIDACIAALPKAHHSAVSYLLEFLSIVESKSERNMMTDTNIAICFAPNILRPRVETYEKVAKDTPITIGVVRYLIASYAAKMKEAGLLGGSPVVAQAAAAAPAAAVAPVAAAVASAASGTASPVRSSSPVAGERAASPARFAISPPQSPRGGQRAVEEYSSTSAEAIAAASTAAANEDPSVAAAEQPKAFVPTVAQFDLANAMANAMANRGALKSRAPQASSPAGPTSGQDAQPVFGAGLKKMGPPSLPIVAPVVQPKKIELKPPARRPSTSANGLGGVHISHGHAGSHSSQHSHSSTPIPDHFERFKDPNSGKYYYFNKLTNKVTWRKPDCVDDALDEADLRQVFPPPAPTEAPPADTDDGSASETTTAAVVIPIHAPMDSRPSGTADSLQLPAILPAPPKQPRRTSSMFGGVPALLPPPPVPVAEAIREDNEDDGEDEAEAVASDDDSDLDIPVPPSAPAAPSVPTSLPPPFGDEDEDFDTPIPIDDLPPPPPPTYQVAPAAAEAEAEAPVVQAEEASEPAAVPSEPVVAEAAAEPIVEAATQPASAEPVAEPVAESAAEPIAIPVDTTPATAPATADADEDDDLVEEDEEWEEYTDAVSGKVYFFNKSTNTTTWTNPWKTKGSAGSAAGVSTETVKAPAEDAPVGPTTAATFETSSSSFPSPLYGGWECTEIRGRWDAASAAGVYPNFASWSANPQFHVGVVEEPKEDKGKQQVVIQLQWRGLERVGAESDDSASEASIAGFYVLVNNGPSYSKLFIQPEEIAARSDFTGDGSVTVNLLLEGFSVSRPGPASAPFMRNYVVIPSTFEPGYTGEFTLSVHSASATWLQPVRAKDAWQAVKVASQWLGDTAGGCRNHAATFPNNPQFTLTSSLVDRPTPVLVLLTQQAPLGGAAHPIGWYAINSSSKVVAKGAFQANATVHAQFELQPQTAPHVLVPCTFAPSLEASFTLAVYAPPDAGITLTHNPRV